MVMQTFGLNAQRVGVLKAEILMHAAPKEVLGITGQQYRHPKNVGDTAKFRRWLPYGGTTTSSNTINRWSLTAGAHVVTEGVTPSAESLTPQDITVQLQEYACLYGITDKTADLYEDDLPAAMKKQTGQRMGLVRELVRYNALKAGTNAYYAGGTSRATVSQVVSLAGLRKIARNLMANHAEMITEVIDAGAAFNSSPVEAGFLVFCNSDLNADIRNLPGFKHVTEYARRKPVHDCEIGSCEEFRFIWSPELAAYADSGVAVGTTGLSSTTGANIDVYPMLVVAEDAFGVTSVSGSNSFDLCYIPTGQKDKNDPLGQRGYIGAKFYFAATILNQGWMAVYEVGSTNLTA